MQAPIWRVCLWAVEVRCVRAFPHPTRSRSVDRGIKPIPIVEDPGRLAAGRPACQCGTSRTNIIPACTWEPQLRDRSETRRVIGYRLGGLRAYPLRALTDDRSAQAEGFQSMASNRADISTAGTIDTPAREKIPGKYLVLFRLLWSPPSSAALPVAFLGLNLFSGDQGCAWPSVAISRPCSPWPASFLHAPSCIALLSGDRPAVLGVGPKRPRAAHDLSPKPWPTCAGEGARLVTVKRMVASSMPTEGLSRLCRARAYPGGCETGSDRLSSEPPEVSPRPIYRLG